MTAGTATATADSAAPPSDAAANPDPLRVAVIIGSTRAGRFAPTVADWFLAGAAEHRPDLVFDLIDLAEADLPLTMTGFGQPRPEAVAALAPRLVDADAFVVVTPEYNHSFPAVLKSAIDWYHGEWSRKPVAFISYGGVSGGLRAVQQLRHVFIELSAVPIRDTISFTEYWNQFAEDQSWPRPSENRDKALVSLLDQLVWTATTLRAGRRREAAG
ncbi:NADPH-dependent FMN reductase [Catenulispora acidiphila DSM 44928]|uniref:NADPH-dependent FMN reductase n=1 Tax=Catenulispora acidiphila (strain DSM 44928 / JCM 14897 / NBRC 102108 / NRRL B-24433 / ID139908) TaxID=479433 RepID=C7QF34_CATAD|nr:NAD(P)H-dependent oxidoreductase [Catenulispora acidiphila]ACU74792.1 NADPH-dependent FMN reductase [Catenulispora acidiphila DSM 44928]